MFDFGDELTIERYNNIPWLIWIQILVLLLLIFLLYCSSFFTLDLSDHNPSSASTSSSAPFFDKTKHGRNSTSTIINRFQHTQVGQNQSIKGELATSTGRRIVREDNTEGNCSSSMDADYDYHPCNYFRLAKLAFLKCFGLDLSSENSSRSERKKER